MGWVHPDFCIKGTRVLFNMERVCIYVIGDSAKEPERIAYLKKYFLELKLHVTYFQPTYKDTLSQSELSRFTTETHGRLFKNSEKSLVLNFLYLFETLQTQEFDYVLILESDVIFSGNLLDYMKGLQEFLKTKPDGASLGSGCDMIDDCIDTDDMSLQITKNTRLRCTDTLLFSKSGSMKLLEFLQTYGTFDEPIDNCIEKLLQKDFNFYWVWPSITVQGSQYGYYSSSIQ